MMSAHEEHDAWKSARATAVTGPEGNLALVETRWTGAAPDIAAEQSAAAETVRITPIQRKDIDSGETEHGLRVWDADAPAIRAFDRIDTYEYDPAWVLEGRFTPIDGARTVPFEHIRDNGGTRDLAVPGDIHLELDGREYTLAAFDDGGTLLLVFGDETNGSETYGSGRFLFVELRDDAGSVVLDFNRAFVPPCGFSAQYNCPLPPASNRFPLPIRAGEKNVVFTGGFDIYAA
ncbi:DUF1684 domain-containing protein [Microbacterium sp. ZW T5_45]|uniref:DUF1684 domain-containing protein n=1 Tax=Microbacterium sp. ZW T5_45 TaxID=3378080 RepID=UPI003851A6E1